MNPLNLRSQLLRQAVSRFWQFLAQRWRNVFYLYLAAIFSVFVVVPKVDPEIVIVDINEASLAAMAKEYGRWPWPRQVLAEFLEHLEVQTNNTYFSMLRLNPADDNLSQVQAAQLPGVRKIENETPQMDATVAVVLPHFKSVQKTILTNELPFRHYAVQSQINTTSNILRNETTQNVW